MRHDSDSLQTVDTTPFFVCLVQRSTWGLSLTKWSSLHSSLSLPKHSGAVVLMFFWSTNTHFRNRCHRQADSLLSIHTASGFIDSEGGRVCSYKQHIGVLLKDTLQTLYLYIKVCSVVRMFYSTRCTWDYVGASLRTVMQWVMHFLKTCLSKYKHIEQWRHNGDLWRLCDSSVEY